MKNEPIYVAVYGTLMRGQRNERWAREANADVVGEGTTLGWLYDTGCGFPAIQPLGTLLRVAVEVLATDEAGVAHMDVLEGYPNLYRRERVLVTLADGREVSALVYVMNRLPKGATLIEPTDGVADWRAYAKKAERWCGYGER